jgi:hypothetical protein
MIVRESRRPSHLSALHGRVVSHAIAQSQEIPDSQRTRVRVTKDNASSCRWLRYVLSRRRNRRDRKLVLIGTILENLGLRFRSALIKNQATVLVNTKGDFEAPVFSPYARTHKFELSEKPVKAKRFQGAWLKWLRDEVNDLLAHNEPSEKACAPSSTNTGLRSDRSTPNDRGLKAPSRKWRWCRGREIPKRFSRSF